MKGINDIFKPFKAFTSGLMLVVYLLVIFYPVIHENHSHSEEKEQICTLEEELNPCHQATHHFQSSTACEHKVHLEKLENECELCDSTFTKVHYHNLFISSLSIISFSGEYNTGLNRISSQLHLQLPTNRGPPSLFNS